MFPVEQYMEIDIQVQLLDDFSDARDILFGVFGLAKHMIEVENEKELYDKSMIVIVQALI